MLNRGSVLGIAVVALAVAACSSPGSAREGGQTAPPAATAQADTIHRTAQSTLSKPADPPRSPVSVRGSVLHSVRLPGLEIGDFGTGRLTGPVVTVVSVPALLPGLNVGDFGAGRLTGPAVTVVSVPALLTGLNVGDFGAGRLTGPVVTVVSVPTLLPGLNVRDFGGRPGTAGVHAEPARGSTPPGLNLRDFGGG